MDKYHYRAYGLNIASDVELPEMEPSVGDADVEISLGDIEGIDEEFVRDKTYEINLKKVKFHLKDQAGCQVINGQKAVVMPKPFLSNSTLRLIIHTSILGCVFFQRKMSTLHGSSIVIGDNTIIIAGHSGAGKSTLTSAFLERGFGFLADDISVVGGDSSGDLFVQPGYPFRKLHQDSAELHSIDTRNLERIEYEEDKFLVPAGHLYVKTPKHLKALVEIIPKDVDDVSIEKIKGISKLYVLTENLYRGGLIQFFDLKAHYYERMGEIASKIDVYRLIRPENRFTPEKQVDLILRELGM